MKREDRCLTAGPPDGVEVHLLGLAPAGLAGLLPPAQPEEQVVGIRVELGDEAVPCRRVAADRVVVRDGGRAVADGQRQPGAQQPADRGGRAGRAGVSDHLPLIATVLCESSGTARKGRETQGKAVITAFKRED
eukprot:SAG22_NODE_1388_length_4521_cov_13.635233_1_plen_133_part_10